MYLAEKSTVKGSLHFGEEAQNQATATPFLVVADGSPCLRE